MVAGLLAFAVWVALVLDFCCFIVLVGLYGLFALLF